MPRGWRPPTVARSGGWAQAPERAGEAQFCEDSFSFVRGLRLPGRIPAIRTVPNFREPPLLTMRQDAAAFHTLGLAPTRHMLFRPEEQHGLSIEDDVVPPPAGGKRVVRNALASRRREPATQHHVVHESSNVSSERVGGLGHISSKSASRWFGAGEPGLVLHENLKPVGACSAYRRVSFFLPRHSIPAAFLDNGSSLPGACLLQCLESRFMVRLTHELSDTDRRPRRQDRRIALVLGGTGSGPAAPGKADDRCDDRSTKKCPSPKLKLRHGLWLH